MECGHPDLFVQFLSLETLWRLFREWRSTGGVAKVKRGRSNSNFHLYFTFCLCTEGEKKKANNFLKSRSNGLS